MNVNVNVPGLSGTGVWGAATGPGRGLVGWDVRVGWWVWMVVRFVCVIRVIRVPVCLECVPSPPAVSLNRILPERSRLGTRTDPQRPRPRGPT